MPWLRRMVARRTGLVTWSLEWREGGRVRSRVLGPVGEATARYELAAMQAGKRLAAPAVATPAAEAVAGYLGSLEALGRRPGTVSHDRDKLGVLLRSMPGPLRDWTRRDLERVLAGRAWCPSRVRSALGVYRRFVRWCRGVGVLCPDFVGDLKPPKDRRERRDQVLAPEELRRLLDAVRDHPYLEPVVALAVYAGLSRGDIRALSWREVNLDAGLIVRPRSKTGVPLRLPIVAPLAEVLRRHRRASGPVCRDLPTDPSIHRALRRVCAAAGVPTGGLHRLRHTLATALQHDGVGLATIGRLLGHRPGSPVTLRYMHTDDATTRAAAEAVAAKVRGPVP